MDSADPGPDLRDYAALLRRRWRTIAAGTLAGLAAAAVALLVAPETYTGTSSVQVRPTGIAELTGERSGRTNGEVNLDTEAQVARSAQVAAAAAELMGTGASAADLRERVSVTVPPNSSVLEIGYSAIGPDSARQGAEAFADAYLAHRTAEVESQVDRRLDALRKEVDARYGEMEDLAETADDGSGAERIRAESRLEAVQTEIADLNGEINPLAALRDSVVPGEIITAATTPDAPSSPVPAVWLTGGALLGLLAGLALAVADDRGDGRLHCLRDIRRATRAPMLLDLTDDGRATRGVGLVPASGPAGQHINGVAHTLSARMGPGDHVLLVSGTSDGDAGMVAAANLAAAFARIDADVLLVCADPREAAEFTVDDDSTASPEGTAPVEGADGEGTAALAGGRDAGRRAGGRKAERGGAPPRSGTRRTRGTRSAKVARENSGPAAGLVDLPDGPGLAEALADGEDPTLLECRPEGLPGLRVLRHGGHGAADLLQRGAMVDLVHRLRGRARFVIIATAPTSERADAQAVAAAADGVLATVELGRTRAAELIAAVDGLATMGTEVTGIAVVPARVGPQPVIAPKPQAGSAATAKPSGTGAPEEGAASEGADRGTGAADEAAPMPADTGQAAEAEAQTTAPAATTNDAGAATAADGTGTDSAEESASPSAAGNAKRYATAAATAESGGLTVTVPVDDVSSDTAAADPDTPAEPGIATSTSSMPPSSATDPATEASDDAGQATSATSTDAGGAAEKAPASPKSTPARKGGRSTKATTKRAPRSTRGRGTSAEAATASGTARDNPAGSGTAAAKESTGTTVEGGAQGTTGTNKAARAAGKPGANGQAATPGRAGAGASDNADDQRETAAAAPATDTAAANTTKNAAKSNGAARRTAKSGENGRAPDAGTAATDTPDGTDDQGADGDGGTTGSDLSLHR
ncbi:Wzz/FepE/Etk N-terminal domain-containing protein [Nocardiopsis sediminis]|uniref:Wzz/FepE/Etk N-terminal domain-containing protein n=1 Tax=Nocardiopsis sediminis TaxID=1778267 RepID=A0ABV8FHI4_9ACTN